MGQSCGNCTSKGYPLVFEETWQNKARPVLSFSGLQWGRAHLLYPLLTPAGSTTPLSVGCLPQRRRSMFVFSVSGWFPAGATISQPYPHLQLLRQSSPGNAHPPPRLCPPHIHPPLPCRYRTLKIYAFSTRCECLLCGFCSLGQHFAQQALPAGHLRLPSDSTSRRTPLPSG